MNNLKVANLFVRKQIHSFNAFLKEKQIQFIISIVAVIVITLFLYEAEPYNISLWHDRYKILKLSGYGFIYVSLICLYFCFIPLKIFYPDILELYSFLRLFSLFLLFMLCNGVLFWLYTTLVYTEYQANVPSLLKFIIHVCSFSLLFFLYYLWHLLWRNRRNRLKMTEQEKGELITFDKFNVIHTDIMLIKSDENYIFLYYLFEDSPKKNHLRYKISDAEKQLKAYTQFVRVHRFYLINMEYVNWEELDMKFNTLKINGINEEISVGPKFKRNLKNWLAANANYLSQISRN